MLKNNNINSKREKMTKTTLILLLSLLFTLPATLLVSMTEKSIAYEEELFRFENYDYNKIEDAQKSADRARNNLLTLHPIGSSLEALLQTLSEAGVAAKCKYTVNYSKEKDQISSDKKLYYRCNIPSASFFGYTYFTTSWVIEVSFSNKSIKGISITIGYTGL